MYELLKNRAEAVRDERGIGMNSANRIGQLLVDIVDATFNTIPGGTNLDSYNKARQCGVYKVVNMDHVTGILYVIGDDMRHTVNQMLIGNWALDNDGSFNWRHMDGAFNILHRSYNINSSNSFVEKMTWSDWKYYESKNDYLSMIDFAGVLDSVIDEGVGINTKGTKATVYYAKEIRYKNAIESKEGFVVAIGDLGTKYYTVFLNNEIWSNNSIPYKNKIYTDSGGSFFTAIDDKLKKVGGGGNVSREEFDELSSIGYDHITEFESLRTEHNELKSDVEDLKSIISPVTNEAFHVTDQEGKIGLKYDENGLDAAKISNSLKQNLESLLDIDITVDESLSIDSSNAISNSAVYKAIKGIRSSFLFSSIVNTEEEGFYVIDENGFIGFEVSATSKQLTYKIVE